jgi:hypothetical protein
VSTFVRYIKETGEIKKAIKAINISGIGIKSLLRGMFNV